MAKDKKIVLPVLPLKDTHIFPKVVLPVIVGHPDSLEAIEKSVLNFESRIVCLMQKPAEHIDNQTVSIPGVFEVNPSVASMYHTGFICKITQIIKMPDKKIRVLLRGEEKFYATEIYHDEQYYTATGMIQRESCPTQMETQVMIEKLVSEGKDYLRLTRTTNPDIMEHLSRIVDPIELLYFVCMHTNLNTQERQDIIEEDDFLRKVTKLLRKIGEKKEYINLQRSIDNQVFGKINKMQRDHFLSEQLKQIHKELGTSSDTQSEALSFKEKLKKIPLNPEARAKADEELKKLARIPATSPEHFVVYNYLTWIADLPWKKPEMQKVNIEKAAAILDADHFGLEKIKEWIIEYLAVMQFHQGTARGATIDSPSRSAVPAILCFVGPPGVGKTSLGKSIASALGREFIRLSVGGVTDEAEIRGHRKTYIGSMPGNIIQSLKKTATVNTLIMIDEIDKLGKDIKGDPAAALLEVLDPEQNSTFKDHYLEFSFDLSQVFFITTANNLSTIPPALRDRMEIIKLSSYTEHEKLQIAKNFLIPKKIIEFDTLGKLYISIPDKTLKIMIREYTAESGVRELERLINSLFRKSITKFLKKEIKKSITIDQKKLRDFLGVPIFSDKDIQRKNAVGVAYGLAWTAIGGDILPVEVTKYPGSGKFQMTGNIGKVMNESAKAALSLIRKNHKLWGIKSSVFGSFDLHVHIPEGAVPKDGPSAGITLTLAIVSSLSDKPINHNIAMTGEISLSGKILPVGGLTEKIIVAQRYGFKKVIMPAGNEKDFLEIKPEAKVGLEFLFFDKIECVINECIKC
jgi:ATP-dependent Lon protease